MGDIKRSTSLISILALIICLFPARSGSAQTKDVSARNPMILTDSMPLAWRYRCITVERDGQTQVDTLDTIFLKRVENLSLYNPRSSSSRRAFPDSLRREGNTVSAWLVLTYTGFLQYWLEVDTGLYESSYLRRSGSQEMAGSLTLMLPSHDSDVHRWAISADASKWVFGSHAGTFQGRSCQYMMTEWIHTPPNQGGTHYWGLGVGLTRIESRWSDVEWVRYGDRNKSYFFTSLRSVTIYELIDFIPRNSLDRITELHLSLSISDPTLELFRDFTHVQSIDLRGSRITDEAIPTLKDFVNLKILDLRDTRITDAAVNYLKNLATLVELYLPEQLSTPETIAELAAALPHTRINP